MANTDLGTGENLRQVNGLEFFANQLVEGFITGLHKSPYHGFSVEFAEHRLYNVGQSTRHIDWKVFARTDRLYTKEYEEETNLRCLLILDASSSMFYPVKDSAKFRFSAYSASYSHPAIGFTLKVQFFNFVAVKIFRHILNITKTPLMPRAEIRSKSSFAIPAASRMRSAGFGIFLLSR